VAGGILKETGILHWTTPNVGATDDYGFTALPGGYRDYGGNYFGQGPTARFWTSSLDTSGRRLTVGLNYDDDNAIISALSNTVNQSFHNGHSIKFIYTGSASTVTDYDGNVYNIVQIGTQKWAKQNWKCTAFNDGIQIPHLINEDLWIDAFYGAYCVYGEVE
jgi:hypothetical protein